MKLNKKECASCNTLQVIWKNHEGNKYCKSCWNKLKGGETKPPLMSQKRKKQNEEYLKLRDKFLTENSLCQVNFEGCSHYATQVHHTYNGANRDTYFLIQSTWVSTCYSCHSKIHLNPKEARILGLLK